MKYKGTIIAVYGTANIGKSMTLADLGRLLESDGATTDADLNNPDYRAVFKYKNYKIGIQTNGDRPWMVSKALEFFLQQDCHIILIASKTYGGTVDNIVDIANKNDYRVIWTTPLQVTDNLTPIKSLKQHGASLLQNLLDEIIKGNL